MNINRSSIESLFASVINENVDNINTVSKDRRKQNLLLTSKSLPEEKIQKFGNHCS